MSLTISTQLLGKVETRIEDLREAEDMASVQKGLDRLVKAFAELRGTSAAAAGSDAEPVKAKKGRKSSKPKDGGDEKPKVKRPPSEWSLHCTNVLFPLILPAIKEAKEAEKAKGENEKRKINTGFHLNVAGYLKNSGKMNPSADEVKESIEYLLTHPDYKSETQKVRSASNSTDETPKKEKKEVKAAAVAEAAAVIAQIDAVLGESDDEDSDDEDDEKTPLVAFEYKGTNYLKDTYNEVYTAQGRMEWVGTFNGKKITKGSDASMPARVKKLIESQD
jgi:hypothetical protein